MADLIARTWGKNLGEQRNARGWTLEQVADRIGVSWQSVSKWEKGQSRPTVENQAKLAGLYGMTVAMLFPVAAVDPQPYDDEYVA